MSGALMSQPTGDPMPYVCVVPDATRAEAFAALIRDARERRGWSQEDLELDSGVSRATLSRWERGLTDKPDADHVRAVCAALNIDPRRAAVILGYLTAEEVNTPVRDLPEEIEEVLRILQDPAVPEDAKASWVEYLKFIAGKAHRNAS